MKFKEFLINEMEVKLRNQYDNVNWGEKTKVSSQTVTVRGKDGKSYGSKTIVQKEGFNPIDMITGGKKKHGQEREAREAYRNVHIFLDMLTNDDIDERSKKRIAQKALNALNAYGRAVYATTNKHPSD